jgi:RsmE family RNA methyltransferase
MSLSLLSLLPVFWGCAPDTAGESGAAGPSWNPEIRPVVEAYCLGCHRSGGDALPALDSHAAAAAYGDRMLAAMEEGRMPPAPADPIALLLGLTRPQTARDILRDATTLGVGALHFVATERSDPNYAAATLWTSGEWRRHCLAGAAQAFATRLPVVTSNHTLATALAALPADSNQRLALDNYEATCPLSECHILGETPVVLALGPERGWGPADRAALRAHGFTLVHLGTRVLRSETAVIAALTLVRARLGLL